MAPKTAVFISQEALDKTQIPLAFRDYCAHLLPALNECRSKTLYAPWKCDEERVAWQKCQYDEYQRRMRVLEKRHSETLLAKKEAVQEQ
jgi:NADH dehydrogenase (ubiquinone) 1 beta subcomplex subunit 7